MRLTGIGLYGCHGLLRESKTSFLYESAAGVIEEHDLRRSEDTGGNDKLSEHIFGYSWPAGSDNVDIGMRQPQNVREV